MNPTVFPSKGFKEKEKKHHFLKEFRRKLKVHSLHNHQLSHLKNVFKVDLHRGGTRAIVERKMIDINQEYYPYYYLHEPMKHEEYDKVIKTKDNILKYVDYHAPSADELAEIRLQIQAKIKVEKMPEIPAEYMDWLNPHNVQYELAPSEVFETKEWLDAIKKDSTLARVICAHLFDLYNSPPEQQHIASSHSRLIQVSETKHFCILYEKYYANKKRVAKEDDKPMMFLYYIAFKTENTKYKEEIERIKKRYNQGEITKEFILKNARRGYGGLMLADDNIWIKIQGLGNHLGVRGDEANLALSPEESNLLRHEVLYQDENNMERPFYPLFINGQAGSGKSTMLFYLTAHFATLGLKGKPLFLTYSETLLDRAKQDIEYILKAHQDYLLKLEEKEADDIEIDMRTFQKFIIKELIPEEHKDRFREKNYISFHKFKSCYLGKFGEQDLLCNTGSHKRFSEEVAWHVIRAYIKGYDYQKYLSDEDYKEINKGDKTITQATYQYIYENVWLGWYKKLWLEKDQWDDQDLVRMALQHWHENSKPQYPVIFCDEAQDFTRTEVELLFRLSLFSQYDLSNQKIIPIIFGGDPYQTLNPTGFRWDALRSMFVNKFKAKGFKHITLENQTLSFNYRSEPDIVKFANLVTFYRFLSSDKDYNLLPQQPWQSSKGLKPYLFELEKSIKKENIQDALQQNTLFIIPADGREQETQFIEKDPIFREWDEETSGKAGYNIMSTVTAKGLEFRRIVLYKFGENVPESFDKIFTGETLSQNENLRIAYFINKLYVAVTRAKEQLYIVDTEKGVENFWRKYFITPKLNEKTIEAFVTHIAFNKFQSWRLNKWDFEKDFEFLLEGSLDVVKNIIEDDPEKNATEFKEKGMAAQDPELLIRASAFYHKLNKDKESNECEAWANYFQENWAKAGLHFELAGDFIRAMECYWNGQAWQELSNLKMAKGNLFTSRKIVADYMIGHISLNNVINNGNYNNLQSTETKFDTTWRAFSTKLNADLNEKLPAYSKSELQKTGIKMQVMGSKGLLELFDVAGLCYFKTNNYSAAIECWDRIGQNSNIQYYRAKEKNIFAKDEKIYWLEKIISKLQSEEKNQKIHREIIQIWNTLSTSKQINFEEAARYQVFDSYIALHLFNEALKTPINLEPKIEKLLNHPLAKKNKNIRFELLVMVIKEDNRLLFLKNRKYFSDLITSTNIEIILSLGAPIINLVFCMFRDETRNINKNFITAFTEFVSQQLKKNQTTYLLRVLNLFKDWKQQIDNQDFSTDKFIDKDEPRLLQKHYRAILQALIISDINRNDIDKDEFRSVTTLIRNELFIMNNDYVKDIKWNYHKGIEKYLAVTERLSFRFTDLKAAYKLVLDKPNRFGIKNLSWARKGYLRALHQQIYYLKSNDYTFEKYEEELKEKAENWQITAKEYSPYLQTKNKVYQLPKSSVDAVCRSMKEGLSDEIIGTIFKIDKPTVQYIRRHIFSDK